METIQNNKKIPCSVGILTLNSEKVLRRCLESVRDFSEIIICDGNSVDDTIKIAEEYGCKIIKQYDSEEKNLSCVTDKATVRNKNLNASTNDWHLFLDSDDALSEDAVSEIKKIVTNPKNKFLIYRIPMKIFIDGREIRYASNYPMYQIRLFNKKTGANFIRPIHERVNYDKNKFETGTLRGSYNIHWSQQRADNFWKGTSKFYAEHEIEQYQKNSPFFYLKWVIWHRFKIVARIVIYSFKNLFFHGFKNTMPLRIGLCRVGYNLLIAWGSTKKQFFKRPKIS